MFPVFRKRKMELIENGDLRLFDTKGKWKWQASVCLLQTETENEVYFPYLTNDKW
jgi:hypothetical protein